MRLSLESSCIPLTPKAPHETMWNCLPDNSSFSSSKFTRPTREKIHHFLRYHPMNPKQSKDHIPKFLGKLTMQQQMINRLTTQLTHAAPVHNYNPSLAEVVNSKDLIQSCRPGEESHSTWHFRFPHTSPRKNNMKRLNHHGIIGSNLKNLTT